MLSHVQEVRDSEGMMRPVVSFAGRSHSPCIDVDKPWAADVCCMHMQMVLVHMSTGVTYRECNSTATISMPVATL